MYCHISFNDSVAAPEYGTLSAHVVCVCVCVCVLCNDVLNILTFVKHLTGYILATKFYILYIIIIIITLLLH